MADPFIQDFVAETWGNLVKLDQTLMALEKNPAQADCLASAFRSVHTIKGAANVLRLSQLCRVSHTVENLLEKLRGGSLRVDRSMISVIREGGDLIKDLLTGLEATGEEPLRDSSAWVEKIACLAAPAVADASAAVTAETAWPAVVPQDSPATSAVKFDSRQRGGDPSIRVPVAALDRLISLVGELILTRNQLLQLARDDDSMKFAGPISQLDRLTSELQQGVMQTRMQPVSQAWSTLPRLVRDVSRITGKPMELEMRGGETELDRTVLDAIQEALAHLVRNAADHGIERPEIRRDLGKPESGRLTLAAASEFGQVIIRLEDDGAGISRQKVIQTALRQKLISETAADRLSDDEMIGFLFRPGFSTAERVTTVSGRGVGLDVVRTAIDRVGGAIEMTSAPGRGTQIQIKIPLTMAVISALVIESGGQSFAIPQPVVREIVRFTPDQSQANRSGDQRDVFLLRDRVVPLIRLQKALQFPESEAAVDEAAIVLVQVGEEQFGLPVSAVSEPQELVVQPVGAHLKHLPVYHGTTILGDGRAILILDVAGVASQFSDVSVLTETGTSLADAKISSVEPTRLLLFLTAAGDVMAVPVPLISRLEEFPVQKLERCGDRWVVQHQGELLPLLSVVGSEGREISGNMQPVILFSDGRQSFGLMVDQIQDIVNEPLNVQLPSQRPGVLGTAVIAGKATDLLDLNYYLRQVQTDRFDKPDLRPSPRSVLVIDDSLFFRQLVRTALEADGYRTTVSDSAERAMALIQDGAEFDAVLCDIEMPGTNGCQFAEWFRQRSAKAHTPLVAITSLDADVHGPRIMAAGFDRLLIKFHPQQLRQTLRNLFLAHDVAARGLCA